MEKIRVVVPNPNVDTDIDNSDDGVTEEEVTEEEEGTLEDLSWSPGDIVNDRLMEEVQASYAAQGSTQVDINALKPIDLFGLFFDEKVIESIVLEYSLCSTKWKEIHSHSRGNQDGSWNSLSKCHCQTTS